MTKAPTTQRDQTRLQSQVVRLQHDALGAHLPHGMVPQGVVTVDHHALERRREAREQQPRHRRTERKLAQSLADAEKKLGRAQESGDDARERSRAAELASQVAMLERQAATQKLELLLWNQFRQEVASTNLSTKHYNKT